MHQRVFIIASMSLALCGAMSTAAAQDKADKPATVCQDTGDFTPPEIPWMGSFIYKMTIKVRNGRAEDVEVKEIRGPDRASNSRVVKALQQHVKKNYVCDRDDPRYVTHVQVDFPHEVPALEAKLAAQNPASGSAKVQLDAASARALCPTMGTPQAIPVDATGKLLLHVIAEVTDGRVTLVSAKLKMGSNHANVNQMFIDLVDRTLRQTYVCPGNHVFEQEFEFNLS